MKRFAWLIGGIVLGLVIAYFAFPAGEATEGDDKNTKASDLPQRAKPTGKRGSPSSTGKTGVPSSTPASRPKEETTSPSNPQDAFSNLMAKVFTGKASEEEALKFWEQARTGNNLDRIIGDLKNEVESDAENVPARMNLAQTYVVKLLGVPAGPEKGLWAAKAEKLWREVLELEPNHWEARNSIATSLSRYPPFLNKTGDAIREFEQLVEIQLQNDQPEERYADTYVDLARLHQTNGNPAAALEALERGAARHPGNETIVERIETLRSSFKFEDEQPVPAPESPSDGGQ